MGSIIMFINSPSKRVSRYFFYPMLMAMNTVFINSVCREGMMISGFSMLTARLGALAIGAFAAGAMAVGAFAVGALAIGVLAINRFNARQVKIGSLSVDELTIGKLNIREPEGGYAPG